MKANHIHTPILLSMLATTLVACDPTSSRDCGVFDHPDILLWQPLAKDETSMFMSSSGATVELKASERILNLPFIGMSTASQSSDVQCILRSSQSLSAIDGSIEFTQEVTQLELVGVDGKDESLSTIFTVAAPVEAASAGTIVAPLTNLSALDQAVYFNTIKYSPTLVINGFSYTDVLEIEVKSPFNADDAAIDKDIKTLTLARNFGIVSFVKPDGEVFERVAN